MYCSEALYSRHVKTLQRTNPQFYVGVYGVLDEYWDVNTLQCVGESLHSEGVSCCSCTNPQHVHSVLQCQLYVFRCCHLGSYQHACFVLHALHPGKSLFSVALETAWFCSWFPYSGSEVVTSFAGEFKSCCHYLFFCFSRTRTSDDERSFVVAWKIEFF